MGKRIAILLLALFFMKSGLQAQASSSSAPYWKLYSYYGELKLNGYYRNQLRSGFQINEKQQSTLYSAGILLRTKNYIWSPKFITIDLDGEYTPDKANEKYLVIPDQAESRDMSKFDARLTFLPLNKFSISSYFNYGRVYNNRENLSSMRSNGKNWGTTLYYRVKKFPFSIGYTNYNQQEDEMQTGRRFLNIQKNLEGKVNTSFGKTDRHELIASYNDFFRKDFSKTEVAIQINNLSYSGLLFFGARKRSTASTLLSGTWQKGSDIFTRYQAIENVNMELRKNLMLGTNYLYYSDQRPFQSLTQNKIGANLQHQLFQSLHSTISYDHVSTNQSIYDQQLQTGFIDVAYTKKILKKHDLDLSYRYSLQTQNWKGADGALNILNESITLKDGVITLLARPYITPGTIRLRDATGSIIYQENIDYRVIPQNQFIQIERMPGGLIANNTSVFADYIAVQPGTYTYNTSNKLFSAGISLYNRLFNVYYRKSLQDYDHLKQVDFVTLNYFDQQVMGFRLDYKIFNGGAEYDQMKSTVLPYELYRYYINLQGAIKNRLFLVLNGNLYDYKKLNNSRNIRYADVNASATYNIRPKLSLATTLTYRKQQGEDVALDLLGLHTALNAEINKLRFQVMYNYYNRVIYNEKLQFNAFNVQIARKF